MTQQMLILFAIFVERSQIVGETQSVRGSQQAMAIFAFFLFLIYAAFGLMLAIFRDDVIKEGSNAVLQLMFTKNVTLKIYIKIYNL